MIEVLWIDDQHKEEAMIQLIIAAENQGIRLNGFASYEAGFEVLEKGLDRFDCILLDGMFFKKKNQEKGTEDTTGIGAAVNHIHKLSTKKAFPWFVLSGKDKFTSGTNDLLTANEVKCFDKTNPADVDKLFDTIKQVAQDLETFQIKTKYRDVLELCQEGFLGEAQYARIFNLLKCIENHESIAENLAGMRMVMERIFEKLTATGLMPDGLSLNQGSRFLSDRHNDFIHKIDFIHPLFAENVFRLVNILQDGSHDNAGMNLKVQEYLRNNTSNYFQKSIAFLFLDVLYGFRALVKNYSYGENNLLFWERKENHDLSHLVGHIVHIASNGFFTLQDINSKEQISFPSHVPSDAVLPLLKFDTKVYYKFKENVNGKKHITEIYIKD